MVLTISKRCNISDVLKKTMLESEITDYVRNRGCA